MEFKRMQVALRNVRQHSDNWALGRHRVLDIAIAPTVNPNAFTSFFLSALEQVPSVGIKVRALQPSEDAAEVLSGKYHACILPREPRPDPQRAVCSLFRDRLVLGCASENPLASANVVRAKDRVELPYTDHPRCALQTLIQEP